ncbi:MAG: hypothetical protein SPG03_02890 [Veillonella caviae]|uniref:WapI family immunity protein n=1 Tax=Veillonella caviae TaxID=248316 RepID=UPI002A90F4BF|nr:hypothetical protein [Veillonella caviae]MDY5481324.1 hypothetical protein [Veillonella caviae]
MVEIQINLVEKHEEWYEYSVFLEANNFSGTASFGITFEEYELLLDKLEKMYFTLSGDVNISYDDSDDYVYIECTDYGHIKVEAQLGGSWNDNWVKLSFISDQSVLGSIYQQIKAFNRA